MSIRRQSCDPCFRGRRKCDLVQPACTRCERNGKKCHYVYPPQLPSLDKSIPASGAAVTLRDRTFSAGKASRSLELKRKRGGDLSLWSLRGPTTTRYLGHLGELPPVELEGSEAWVADQYRSYPLVFGTQAQTVFIHKSLYSASAPRPLLAAFSICAGCLSMNESNRSFLFQAMDAEIAELLASAPTSTLISDLAKLQAAVLYQTIRIFYGGVEQRIVAERQEYLVRAYALRLLRRAGAELQGVVQAWESWILYESIRRTVWVSFKLYTLYQRFKYGECLQTGAMAILPVSPKPDPWYSEDAYAQITNKDETITYREFLQCRGGNIASELRPFEKLLQMSCGFDKLFRN